MSLRTVSRGVALAFALATSPALAAPCAGFADVQDTDSFCTAVEWLKNRSITLGCAATLYCPGAAVSRAAMALFLNRLGSALTPQLRFIELALGPVDPDSQPALCPTGPIAPAPYPRQALVSIAFGGQSTGDLGFSARPLASTTAGASWVPLTAVAIRESVAGAGWTNSATAGIYAIPANQTVQFAVGVVRESGTADFSQGRCQLVANVLNANGTSTPFD